MKQLSRPSQGSEGREQHSLPGSIYNASCLKWKLCCSQRPSPSAVQGPCPFFNKHARLRIVQGLIMTAATIEDRRKEAEVTQSLQAYCPGTARRLRSLSHCRLIVLALLVWCPAVVPLPGRHNEDEYLIMNQWCCLSNYSTSYSDRAGLRSRQGKIGKAVS